MSDRMIDIACGILLLMFFGFGTYSILYESAAIGLLCYAVIGLYLMPVGQGERIAEDDI